MKHSFQLWVELPVPWGRWKAHVDLCTNHRSWQTWLHDPTPCEEEGARKSRWTTPTFNNTEDDSRARIFRPIPCRQIRHCWVRLHNQCICKLSSWLRDGNNIIYHLSICRSSRQPYYAYRATSWWWRGLRIKLWIKMRWSNAQSILQFLCLSSGTKYL